MSADEPVAQNAPPVSKPKSKPSQKKPASKTSAPQKNKPERFLPTERITFKRQLELLRAYAAASGGGKAVSNKEVATFVKMTESTTSMGNAFFTQNGFLSKIGGGLVPAPEVVAFHRAYNWTPETASHKLAPLVARTWFAEALLPRLSLNALDEEQAIWTLAEAANADTKYRVNLKLLIDYLEASSLVIRGDGGMVKLNQSADAPSAAPVELAPSNGGHLPPPEIQPRGAIATMFSAPTEASIRFQIDVNVKMDEMATWPADRIAAFFAGIGQVMAAKGAMEKKVTGE